MVVLCIHGTKHWWERLRWICDIAELVNSHAVTDWSRLEKVAADANSRRSVDLGLWLAVNQLSAPVPVPVRRRLDGDPSVRKLGRQIERWQGQRNLGDPSRNVWERFLFRMRTCETTRDRVPQIVNYLLARPPRTITVGHRVPATPGRIRNGNVGCTDYLSPVSRSFLATPAFRGDIARSCRDLDGGHLLYPGISGGSGE